MEFLLTYSRILLPWFNIIVKVRSGSIILSVRSPGVYPLLYYSLPVLLGSSQQYSINILQPPVQVDLVRDMVSLIGLAHYSTLLQMIRCLLTATCSCPHTRKPPDLWRMVRGPCYDLPPVSSPVSCHHNHPARSMPLDATCWPKEKSHRFRHQFSCCHGNCSRSCHQRPRTSQWWGACGIRSVIVYNEDACLVSQGHRGRWLAAAVTAWLNGQSQDLATVWPLVSHSSALAICITQIHLGHLHPAHRCCSGQKGWWQPKYPLANLLSCHFIAASKTTFQGL